MIRELITLNTKIDVKPHIITERKYDNISVPNNKYEKEVNTFIKVIKQEINNDNLNIMYNNFNNLKFVDDYENIPENAQAFYKPSSNSIYIKNNTSTIYHELMHAASTYTDIENGILNSGFAQLIDLTEYAKGLNDAYSQLLTERYFDKECLHLNIREKDFLKILEQIVGQEKMEGLYFRADLKGLIDELSKYSDVNDVNKFIKLLDYYYYMLFNPNLINSKILQKEQEIYYNLATYYLFKIVSQSMYNYQKLNNEPLFKDNKNIHLEYGLNKISRVGIKVGIKKCKMKYKQSYINS